MQYWVVWGRVADPGGLDHIPDQSLIKQGSGFDHIYNSPLMFS